MATCAKVAQVQKEGNRSVQRTYSYYNLDMIISIGFRVNSKKAIKFRTWANKIIKDYMIQGFALNDDRFMKARKSDQEYFKRLLERIKLIRTSERMFYQKITDIFAECSIDYNKNANKAITFYKTIQNKFHYAITGQTAAEIVYSRVDANKDNMGLTTWEKSPEGTHLVTEVDGRQTAQIMFFNGLSRTRANGNISYLPNPYLEDNLAFSLQMEIAAAKYYPGFARHIFLRAYRYNMHFKPKTLLVEAGAQTNTVEEMRNAMELLAELLHQVLS